MLRHLPFRKVFQFLPPVWIFATALSVLWGPLLLPYPYLVVVIIFLIYFMAFQVTVLWRFFHVFWNVRNQTLKTSQTKPLLQDRSSSVVKHLIVIPNYKEKVATLQTTLQQLALHQSATTNYIVTLAQEATEQGCEEKAQGLIDEFKTKFFKMYFTVHPAGVEGEVRGKGSNVCYSVREMKRILVDDEKICNLSEVVVTLPDADSVLPERYFQAVDEAMSKIDSDDREFFFLPVVAWVQNSLQVPVFIRMCDAMYSILYNQNLLGLFGIQFPYSTFGLPLQLCHQVDYWDTGADAIGDELHMWLKCFFETHGRLRSIRIWTPVLISNVETETYFGTLKAKLNQSYRWFQGIHDLSFVFSKALAHRHEIPVFKNILICFRIFETILIPLTIPFFLFWIALWQFLPFLGAEELKTWAFALQMVSNVAGGMSAIWFLVYEFFHNHIAAHHSPLEKRKWYRIFEWILATPSMFVFLAVPGIFVACVRFTLKSAEKFVYITAPKPATWGKSPSSQTV